MKKLFLLLMALFTLAQVKAQEKSVIQISTDNTDLILQVAPNGRLYQAYLGDKLLNEQDIKHFSPYVKGGSDGSVSTRGWEVYPGSGAEDYFEPAVAITHSDGNPSTILRYVSSEQKAVTGGTETIINLKDDQYPVEVTLHYIAYPKENVIKTWSEIKHNEKKPVTLWRYASTMLYFSDSKYFLTEFSSDWAKEAQMSSQQLQFGKKVIDTKLGSRAAMHTHPFFELGFGQSAQETQGRVMLGTIGWTGNFQFTFEVDNVGNLRVIPAINPYASDYELKANEVFTTPEFMFTFSNNGTGEASRNLHAWARNYQLKDGQGDRLSLLNNWENTYFKFDEQLLSELMKEYRIREAVGLTGGKPGIGRLLWKEMKLRAVSVKPLDGTLHLEGELTVFVIYEAEDDTMPVQWLEETIPFSGEMEAEGVKEDQIPMITVRLSHREIEAKPDYDGEMRELEIDGVLELDIRLYEELETELLSDVYSNSRELTPERRETVFDRILTRNVCRSRIGEKVKLPQGERILQICHHSGTIKLDEVEPGEDCLKIEGVLEVTLLYLTSDDQAPVQPPNVS